MVRNRTGLSGTIQLVRNAHVALEPACTLTSYQRTLLRHQSSPQDRSTGDTTSKNAPSSKPSTDPKPAGESSAAQQATQSEAQSSGKASQSPTGSSAGAKNTGRRTFIGTVGQLTLLSALAYGGYVFQGADGDIEETGRQLQEQAEEYMKSPEKLPGDIQKAIASANVSLQQVGTQMKEAAEPWKDMYRLLRQAAEEMAYGNSEPTTPAGDLAIKGSPATLPPMPAVDRLQKEKSQELREMKNVHDMQRAQELQLRREQQQQQQQPQQSASGADADEKFEPSRDQKTADSAASSSEQVAKSQQDEAEKDQQMKSMNEQLHNLKVELYEQQKRQDVERQLLEQQRQREVQQVTQQAAADIQHVKQIASRELQRKLQEQQVAFQEKIVEERSAAQKYLDMLRTKVNSVLEAFRRRGQVDQGVVTAQKVGLAVGAVEQLLVDGAPCKASVARLREHVAGKDTFMEAVINSIPMSCLEGTCPTGAQLQRIWPVVRRELEVQQYLAEGGGAISEGLAQLAYWLKVKPEFSHPSDNTFTTRLSHISGLVTEGRFREAVDELESALQGRPVGEATLSWLSDVKSQVVAQQAVELLRAQQVLLSTSFINVAGAEG